jgi:DNA-binding transcriptional regulator YiaG
MKTKIVKKFKYEGFNFPVELLNVTMVMFDGEWHPKIDVRKIAESVMKGLPFQKERLTGDQIKFIRTYFEMSLREFASRVVNESHAAVAKWEKCAGKSTSMDINIEILLRLYVLERVVVNTPKEKNKFFENYIELRQTNYTINKPYQVVKMTA